MNSNLDKKLTRFKNQDREGMRRRFEDQIKTPAHGIPATDYATRLFECLDSLENANRHGFFDHAPPSIINPIIDALQTIATSNEKTKSDAQAWHEQVLNLQSHVWQSGILAFPGEQQRLTLEAGALRSELAHVKEIAAKLATAESNLERIQEHTASAKKSAESALEAEVEAVKHSAAAAEHATKAESAQQGAKGSAEAASKAHAAAQQQFNESQGIRSELAKFQEKVQSHVSQMDTVAKNAQSQNDSVETLKTEVRGWHEGEQRKVANILEQAVAASLFAAFDVRRKQHRVAAWIWAFLAVGSIVGAAFYVYNLAGQLESFQNIPLTGWIRVSITPFLLFLIVFCSKQYTNARNLEEAYAFKSALSVSLEPYKRLVVEMLKNEQEKKHLEFVVETIRQIYSAPSSTKEPDAIPREDIKFVIETLRNLGIKFG